MKGYGNVTTPSVHRLTTAAFSISFTVDTQLWPEVPPTGILDLHCIVIINCNMVKDANLLRDRAVSSTCLQLTATRIVHIFCSVAKKNR